MKQHEEISIRLQEEREKLAIQRQVKRSDPPPLPIPVWRFRFGIYTLEDFLGRFTYSHHPFRKENDQKPNLHGIMFHGNNSGM